MPGVHCRVPLITRRDFQPQSLRIIEIEISTLNKITVGARSEWKFKSSGIHAWCKSAEETLSLIIISDACERTMNVRSLSRRACTRVFRSRNDRVEPRFRSTSCHRRRPTFPYGAPRRLLKLRRDIIDRRGIFPVWYRLSVAANEVTEIATVFSTEPSQVARRNGN